MRDELGEFLMIKVKRNSLRNGCISNIRYHLRGFTRFVNSPMGFTIFVNACFSLTASVQRMSIVDTYDWHCLCLVREH